MIIGVEGRNKNEGDAQFGGVKGRSEMAATARREWFDSQEWKGEPELRQLYGYH
jgi:hypothetical protein